MPKMIYLDGKIDLTRYERMTRESDSKPHVFIFPGNQGHHCSDQSLFSVKVGGGLAHVAQTLGNQGYPALSLPTTGFQNWSTQKDLKQTVDDAIRDLYRALGAGFSLILPVRTHTDQYFDHGLEHDSKLEPSFWGNIEKKPNKPLANYYITEINRLHQFVVALNHDGKEAAFRTLSMDAPTQVLFAEAFRDGEEKDKRRDPWVCPGKLGHTHVPAGRQGPEFFSSTPHSAAQKIATCVLGLACIGFVIGTLTGALPVMVGLIIASICFLTAVGLNHGGAEYASIQNIPR